MRGKILDSYGCELLMLEENNSYSLGRERVEDGEGLKIEDIFVSRKHAALGFDAGFYLTDEGSKNGTFINDKRLQPGEKVYLSNGDKLRLADREYEFCLTFDITEENIGGSRETCMAGLYSERARSKREYGYGRWTEENGNNGWNRMSKPSSSLEERYSGGCLEECMADDDCSLENYSAEKAEDSFQEDETGEAGEWGPFIYSLRSSAAGRRLSVETGKNGCIEYQIRMIEENPGLMIGEVIHVRNLENDCFLCQVDGRFSLKDYAEKSKKTLDGIEIIDRILKLVKLGEEHMLDRDMYFITPATVYVDKAGELMLIYIPHKGKKDRCFSTGMVEICDFLSQICTEQTVGLNAMERVFRENICDTREYIKHVYHYKMIDFPKLGSIDNEKAGFKVPAKYLITICSFLAFMGVFWFADLNYINLGGIFLMLAGGNVLLYMAKPRDLLSSRIKVEP